ncbi:hypothetical protein NCLIV_048210 [Neospora caninum Liverpool]|uniref:Protein kinase, putative n=1 Tax=Neospora caninum (strain Liverpool) TaxID=572307 RepID=F0VMB3_NEOCL|nr:hypothetical protein NCLIV_048210 [Neospora caninum Liverpool]CBZ54391.1 hypothetical protein NCLIV_048210 [Neospora caninum Liverpool]CEL69098.1 TPA: protein kinase, putative [Neospora caninum Liverpool]|eukprot:XP_003884421.1 hypothetical protein NCLIV_048210 [Neospora caninum Liverpool]
MSWDSQASLCHPEKVPFLVPSSREQRSVGWESGVLQPSLSFSSNPAGNRSLSGDCASSLPEASQPSRAKAPCRLPASPAPYPQDAFSPSSVSLAPSEFSREGEGRPFVESHLPLSPPSPSPHAVFSPLLPFSSSLVSSLTSPVDAPPLYEAREDREPSRCTSSRERGDEAECRAKSLLRTFSDDRGDAASSSAFFLPRRRPEASRDSGHGIAHRVERNGEHFHSLSPGVSPSGAEREPVRYVHALFSGCPTADGRAQDKATEARDRLLSALPSSGAASPSRGEEVAKVSRRGHPNRHHHRTTDHLSAELLYDAPHAYAISSFPSLGAERLREPARGRKRRDRETTLDFAASREGGACLDFYSPGGFREEADATPRERGRKIAASVPLREAPGSAREDKVLPAGTGRVVASKETKTGRGRRRRRARARRRAARLRQASGHLTQEECPEAQPTDRSPAPEEPGAKASPGGDPGRKKRVKTRAEENGQPRPGIEGGPGSSAAARGGALEKSRLSSKLAQGGQASDCESESRVLSSFYPVYAPPVSSPLPSYVSSSSGLYSSSRGVSWAPRAPEGLDPSHVEPIPPRYFSCSSRLPSSVYGDLPSSVLSADLPSVPPGPYFASFSAAPPSLSPSSLPFLCPSAHAPPLPFSAFGVPPAHCCGARCISSPHSLCSASLPKGGVDGPALLGFPPCSFSHPFGPAVSATGAAASQDPAGLPPVHGRLPSGIFVRPEDRFRLWRYCLWQLQRQAARRREKRSGSGRRRRVRSRGRSDSSCSSPGLFSSKKRRARERGRDGARDRKRHRVREASRHETAPDASQRHGSPPVKERRRSAPSRNSQQTPKERVGAETERHGCLRRSASVSSRTRSAGDTGERQERDRLHPGVLTPTPGALGAFSPSALPASAWAPLGRVSEARSGEEGEMGDTSSSRSRRSHRRRHDWGGEGRRERTGGSRRSRTRYKVREQGRSASFRPLSVSGGTEEGKRKSGEERTKRKAEHTLGSGVSSMYRVGVSDREEPSNSLPSSQRDGQGLSSVRSTACERGSGACATSGKSAGPREGSWNGTASVHRHHKRRDGRGESEGGEGDERRGRADEKPEKEGNRGNFAKRSKGSFASQKDLGRDRKRGGSPKRLHRDSEARDENGDRENRIRAQRLVRGDGASSRSQEADASDGRRAVRDSRRKTRRGRSLRSDSSFAHASRQGQAASGRSSSSRRASRDRAKRRKDERRGRSDGDSYHSRKRRRDGRSSQSDLRERSPKRGEERARDARESPFPGGARSRGDRREREKHDEKRGHERRKMSCSSRSPHRSRRERSASHGARRERRERKERERRRGESSSSGRSRRYERRKRRYGEDSCTRYESYSQRAFFPPSPFFYPSRRPSQFPSLLMKHHRPPVERYKKHFRFSEISWREKRQKDREKKQDRDERGERKRAGTRRRDAAERRRAKKKEKKEDAGSKDDIVHFDWRPGMWLSDRYRVLDKMGEGTFGRVLRCADVHTQRDVAIKVVRDVSRYTSAAKIEVDILREINERDAGSVSSLSPAYSSSHCVRLHDAFLYKSRHMCLVFEKLGKSLYDLLTDNHYQGFYLEDIRIVAKQCLIALAFLRVCRLTHTDLKPENILLLDDVLIPVPAPRPSSSSSSKGRYLRPAKVGVKVIDFGSATFEDDYHSSLINTRQYRAPEVILGLGWDMSSDVWSLGCILMELYTGNLLFRTHEHLEHLAMMERIIGPMPPNMLEAAVSTDGRRYLSPSSLASNPSETLAYPPFFEAGEDRDRRDKDRRDEREQTTSRLRLHWPEGASSTNSEERVRNCVPLHALVLPHHRAFADFVSSLLQIDPQARPTPGDALLHPFFAADLTE